MDVRKMIPEYREYPASAALAPWVVCYWTRAAFATAGEPLIQRVLPDGCADVIFDLQAAALAVGTMTTTLVLREQLAPASVAVFRAARGRHAEDVRARDAFREPGARSAAVRHARLGRAGRRFRLLRSGPSHRRLPRARRRHTRSIFPILGNRVALN